MNILIPFLSAAFLLLSHSFASGSAASSGDPFIEKYLGTAARLAEEGDIDGARAAVERALERDDQHLAALRELGRLSTLAGDNDVAAWSLHRWLQIVDAAEDAPVSKSTIKQVHQELSAIDERAEDFRDLTNEHIDQLLKLAKAHMKRDRMHSALEVYQEILLINQLHPGARAGIRQIRRTGGEDVAVEDAFAGAGDPTEGLDPEWIADEDAKHAEWKDAYTKETDNYRYRTNAGFLVLQTSSIAMEQMNRAYRKFFRYKEDGGATPKIGVLVYQTRDEYLKHNGLPEDDWTGGFFNGSTVQTFLGGASGTETIRQMYGTLFHEAAHQFVSLTGRGGVPGWLNEAYASFFEGTTILSNSSVRWNQVATHRLFPLARRMDAGWMSGPHDGVRDESGGWSTPTGAPTLSILVENDYTWGPPWYAPTWGVVYFLYNLRDDDGQLVYRDSLNQYYYSNANSVGRDQRVEHFEEVVIRGAPLSPVENIEELNQLWADWILELRDIQLGKKAARKSNFDFGQAALERGETDAAVDFLEEAFLHTPEDPEVLWKLAGALEATEAEDRAAALYLQFARELELRGKIEDERYAIAKQKLEELDPSFKAHAKLRQKMLTQGLELARSYRERKLPLMALEIARRMSAQFSLPEALDFYAEVASETGRSLARWRIAYNELDLDGWSGSEHYRAYGRMIEAKVEDDVSVERNAGEFFTADLTYDAAFDGDYSLEAEMRFSEDTTIAGLTFGRKDSNTTHAVILHPKGFLDISTKDGGSWTYRDHRSVGLSNEWNKLRIDLVGKTLDVYLNDRYIRSLEMPSRDSVQGGFGLITGTGQVDYRNLRYLSRDPYDPAARIERELALKEIQGNEEARPTGTFSGFAPPALPEGLEWLQGEARSWDQLHGAPTALMFWSANQEKIIPTAKYYAELQKTYGPLGFQFIVVIGGEHSSAQVKQLLAESPLPGISVARDADFDFYKAANVVPGGWGMPRILLVDADGRVTWEGDPGLAPGEGWKPGAGETYLDGPIKEIVDKRLLREIQQHADAIDATSTLIAQGELARALERIAPLADLDAEHSPIVLEARGLRDQIEGAAARLLASAEQQAELGYPLRSAALLEKVINDFGSTLTAELARQRSKALQATDSYRKANKAMRTVDKVLRAADRDKPTAEILLELDKLPALSDSVGMQELHQKLRQALVRDGAVGVTQAWQQVSPEAYVNQQLLAITANLD